MLTDVRGAAKLLKVSRAHARRQIKAGLWPIYRLGQRVVRIDVEEVKALSRVSNNVGGQTPLEKNS